MAGFWRNLAIRPSAGIFARTVHIRYISENHALMVIMERFTACSCPVLKI